MEKQIILFNGGMNTKVAPHLVGENQAIECHNIDLTKGSIYPIKEFGERATLEATGYSNILFNGHLVSSEPTEKRSYAKFGSRLYFTNGSYGEYGLYRWNGTDVVDAVPPQLSSYYGFGHTYTAGNLTGEYSYVYTVVDTEGIESAPSPVATFSVTDKQIELTATGTEVIVGDQEVAYRRLYRTGGSNPTFNLIGEFAPTALSFVDNIRDIDVSRIELTTFEEASPPADLINLVQVNGTMWASTGNRVYFSGNGLPESWNALDFIVLDDVCTGLGVFVNTVIAFTSTSCYVISGTNRDNVYINKLPYQEGCLEHDTIANVTQMLVWTSANGICAYNGSEVSLITKNILDWSGYARLGSLQFDVLDSSFDSNTGYVVTSAVGLNDKYYAVFQNGIGIIDMNNGVVASIIDFEEAVSIYYDYEENAIGVVDENLEITILDAGEFNMSGNWKTGLLHQGDYSVLKDYRKIEFDVAPTNVKVYMEDRKVLDISNVKQFHLPPNSIGRAIQLDIYSNKEIRSVYIQYGIVG